MGIFHTGREVVNRTCRPLNVRFDGQDMNLEPNYDEAGNRIEGVVNIVPEQAIDYAINQNPIMGTEHLESPSTFEALVGIVLKKGEKPKWYNECGFFDEKAWVEEKGVDAMTRVPLSEITDDDETVKGIKVRGRSRDRVEAGRTTPFDVRARS